MIWIFGDSYSETLRNAKTWADWNTYQQLEKNWIDILSDKLDSEYHSFSRYGTANDFIFSELLKNNHLFKKNDYVIIVPTHMNRKWFFEDRPHLANFVNCIIDDQISKDENRAIKEYTKYLFNDKADLSAFNQFVYGCFFAVQQWQLGGVNTLILPAFHEVQGPVKGYLQIPSNEEFCSQEVRDNFYKKNGMDPRLNHLSESNHAILANKIYRFFKRNESIDLYSGFEKNIYN